jgi:ABC-type uncharacterized transport system permease subunit
MPVLLLATSSLVAFSATGAVLMTGLLGERERNAEPLARRIAALALALAVATLLVSALEEGAGALLTRHHVGATLAVMLGGAWLGMSLRASLSGAGMVVAPLAALGMAFWIIEHGSSPAAAHATLPPLLLVHVGLALAGLAAFGLAASLSVLYLVQERQLRQRTFGRLFRRLPSLHVLDGATFHLVAGGFVLYSLGLLLGMAGAATGAGLGWDIRLIMAVLAWTLFALVIHTRITRGWRGRQAAILTVLGCLGAFAVLASYAFPSV